MDLRDYLFHAWFQELPNLKGWGGEVKLSSYECGSVIIGFGPIQASFNEGRWYNTGSVIFGKGVHIYRGFFIYNNGTLILGDASKLGASKYFCEKSIRIGDDTMVSWDCIIMDSDLHTISDYNGKRVNADSEIVIGSHVWIGYGCSILKGVTIANNSIIASNSIISNKNLQDNDTIYTSYGKKLKTNVKWFWENN